MTQNQGGGEREVLEERTAGILSTNGGHDVSSWPAASCMVTGGQEEGAGAGASQPGGLVEGRCRQSPVGMCVLRQALRNAVSCRREGMKHLPLGWESGPSGDI